MTCPEAMVVVGAQLRPWGPGGCSELSVEAGVGVRRVGAGDLTRHQLLVKGYLRLSCRLCFFPLVLVFSFRSHRITDLYYSHQPFVLMHLKISLSFLNILFLAENVRVLYPSRYL